MPAMISIMPIYDPLHPVKNSVIVDNSANASEIIAKLYFFSLRKYADKQYRAGIPATNYPPSKFGFNGFNVP